MSDSEGFKLIKDGIEPVGELKEELKEVLRSLRRWRRMLKSYFQLNSRYYWVKVLL